MGPLGQTYPMRYTDSYPPHMQKDIEQLLLFLYSKDTWNFYGFGHGNPAKFMGISPGDFKNWTNAKRFRFAFLDGCQTFSKALLTAFGADGDEIDQKLTLPDYQNTIKKRPAAYLSWSVLVPRGFKLVTAEYDERTGKQCYFKHLTSRCNWHVQLLSYWYNNSRPLKESIDAANAVFTVKYENNEPDLSTAPLLDVIDINGNVTKEKFDPKKHLKLSGFKDLMFNAYNHAADWSR